MQNGHEQSTTFDVIILGSGFAGSVLGAVLARNGASVLIVDAGVHPRFAVGESTTHSTLNLCRILGLRYDVPELTTLLTTDGCTEAIGPSFGVKRNFGFMLHREGAEPDPREANQFAPPSLALQSSHLHRPASDEYLFHVAIRYGCVARQAFRVVGLDLREDGVEIEGQQGDRYRGRYLVDASGFRSPLATELGLRAGPDALKHHSRSLFTHMLDVRPTDDCLQVADEDRPPVRWVEGTMHHLIERGWFWIIPFNNDPRSRNPLVSVGLTIDERRYPKPADLSPEAEFRSHVDRYPLLQRIFADAKTVRPWVSTDRLQYTSTAATGHRWCLMSHAAGFIDALYSRGLTNTCYVINSLAWRLLGALDDDDFSVERFAYLDRLQEGLIRYNDELVNCSFIAFEHYPLWNAVCRVWAGAEIPTNLAFERLLQRYRKDSDDAVLKETEHWRYPGLFMPDSPAYKTLFDEMVRLCEAVDRGALDPTDAGRTLMAQVVASEAMVPHIGIDEPDTRFVPIAAGQPRMMRWLATEAPEEMRDLSRVAEGMPGLAKLMAAHGEPVAARP